MRSVRRGGLEHRAAAAHLDTVAGSLAITADPTFGEAFVPALVTEFLERHPHVRADARLTSRKVDLVQEGFDVAFRIGLGQLYLRNMLSKFFA